jgi:glycosyltransferase involved in cell wall biosynthesis
MTTLGNRVLFVATGLNCGGAETQVFHLAKGLRARGWEVEVVSLLSGGFMANQFRQQRIPLSELGMHRGVPDPRAVLRLSKIIRSFRPDIVHSHMVHANLLARITRLVCPIPVLIATVHNMTEHRRWTENAYRLTDSLGDLTTIICNAARKNYVDLGCVPAGRLKVVANGLPIEQFRPDSRSRAVTRQQFGIGDEFVWLAVGRFEPPKNYPNLISALVRVPSRRDLFLIAGDGPLRSQIEKSAVQQNVSHRIRFLGIRKDVPALMAAADAYLMSSAWEGLPMVLLEAAGSGLPIVATDVGGTGEIVRDGITGYLVQPSDPIALAKAVLQMEQALPSARAAMGAAGREFVIKNYSLSSVLGEWESIYQSFSQKKSQLAHPQAAC